MISLGSNGDLGQAGQLPWMGTDAHIRYPAVSSCITITCVVGTSLVGCHLYAMNRPDKMNESLQAFALTAMNATAICIAGVFSSWQPNYARNLTGYNLASLSIKIVELTKFNGAVVWDDTSTRGETLDATYVNADEIQLVVS